MAEETKIIDRIECRKLREVKFDNEKEVFEEKLVSGRPISSAIIFIRKQYPQWKSKVGEAVAFLPDTKDVDLSNVPKIEDIKLLLEY